MNLLQFVFPQGWFVRQHPLYAMERRRLKLKRTLENLMQYSQKWTIIGGIVIVGLWVVLLMFNLNTVNDRDRLFDTSGQYLSWLLYGGLGGSVILDLASILASVTLLSRDRSGTLWDLLRMTNMHRPSMVLVWHTVAQLRAWRITLALLCLRTFTVLLIGFHAFLPYSSWDRDSIAGDVLYSLSEDPVIVVSMLMVLVVLSITYLLEPIWRMRTVTAMGITVSARVKNPLFAILGGGAAAAMMWIAQAIIFGFLGWFLIRVLSDMNLDGDSVAFVFLVAVSFSAWLLNAFYRKLRDESLWRAQRSTFPDEY